MTAINLTKFLPGKRQRDALMGLLVSCSLLFQTFVIVGHSSPAPVLEDKQSLLYALKKICRANPIEEDDRPQAPLNLRDASCLVCQVSSIVALLPCKAGLALNQNLNETIRFPHDYYTASIDVTLAHNPRGPPALLI